MEVSYKRELEQNYLILRQEEPKNDYQVEMLVKNHIPGILECRSNMVDGRCGLYYLISSRQSLRLVLERKKLEAGELSLLLKTLYQALRSCQEYLLDVNKLLLCPDYIYVDPDSWEPVFCHCPFQEQDMEEELLGLAEYLLDHLCRQDQEAVTLAYEFYRMAGERNGSLFQMLQDCMEYSGEPKAHLEKQAETVQTSPVETTFLAEKPEDVLMLCCENSTYPDFRVGEENILIGKKKEAVDVCLKARGISRIHAKISREEGVYYLTDLNSTNGTFLNSSRLEVHEKVPIQSGDSIGFAGIRYQVE